MPIQYLVLTKLCPCLAPGVLIGVCELATVAVVRRGGAPEPDFSVLASMVSGERLAAIREAQVQMPLIELSSTDLRERAAAGRSLRYRTPRAVEKYIETHGLYGNTTAAS